MKLTVSYVHHKLIMKPIIIVLLCAVVSLDNTPNYNFDLITGKAFIGKFTECMPYPVVNGSEIAQYKIEQP